MTPSKGNCFSSGETGATCSRTQRGANERGYFWGYSRHQRSQNLTPMRVNGDDSNDTLSAKTLTFTRVTRGFCRKTQHRTQHPENGCWVFYCPRSGDVECQHRRCLTFTDQVSSMSQSSPSAQRIAESLPLIMPQSKCEYGPKFPLPSSRSVFRRAF